jgi:hypothetical protein
MKKIVTQLAIILVLTTAINPHLSAQQSPPDPPGNHGQSGNQEAGSNSAPIGGGLGILLALGAAYGGKKVYKAWQQKDELEA